MEKQEMACHFFPGSGGFSRFPVRADFPVWADLQSVRIEYKDL